MADGKVTIETELDDSGMNKGLTGLAGKASSLVSGVAKVVSVGVAAAGAGVVGLAKKAVASYGEYEQMVGGVQKLYGNMGKSLEDYAAMVGKSTDQVASEWQKLETAQNIVLQDAANAFRDVGMSANQYMQIATSFSAALINSLGGDSVKAAEQTKKAMQAISDNWNTFGGDLGMIQGAFQAFAKQNYMLLDNLKLGYGGTKTEMERLIKDANEYAKTIGEASDLSIDSFSDIVDAIDLIQRKQGIAGTTAREAATTIQGSLNMTKAAWENLITGMADKNADFDKLFNDLVSSLETTLNNILPVIEKALESIATLIEKLAPKISERLPELVSRIVPPLINAAGLIVNAVIQALPSIIKGLWDAAFQENGAGLQGFIVALMAASSKLTGNAFAIFKPVGKAIGKGIEAGYEVSGLKKKVDATIADIAQNFTRLGPKLKLLMWDALYGANEVAGKWSRTIPEVIGNAFNALPGKMASIGSAVGTGLSKGLTVAASGIGTAIRGIGGLFSGLGTLIKSPVGIIITAISLLVIGFVALYNTSEKFRGIVDSIGKTLMDSLKKVIDFFMGVFEQIRPILDQIGEQIGSQFKGLIDNLMPSFIQIGQAFSDLIQAIMPILSELGKMFAETFTQLIQELVPLFQELGTTFGELFSQMIPIFKDLGSVFSSTLTDTISQLLPVVTELAHVLSGVLWTSIQAVASILQALIPALSQIALSLLPVLGEIIAVVAGVVAGVLVVAIEAVMQIIQVLVPIIANLISSILPLIVPIIQLIANIISTIVPLIANIISAIVPLILNLVQSVLPLIIPVIETITNLISAILPVISMLITTILPPLISLISAILSVLQPIIEFIAGTVIAVIQTVVSIIQGICQVLTGDFSGAAATFQGLLQGIADFWINIWNSIASFFSGIWNGITSFLGSVVSNMSSTIGNGINSVVNWFAGLPGRILGALGNLGGILVNAGRSIIEGFLNGLKSAFEGVKNFVGGIGDWIASHKGPKQYDLHLLRPAGRWIITGLRESMMETIKPLYKEVRKIGPTINDEIQKGLALSSVVIGSNLSVDVDKRKIENKLQRELEFGQAAILTALNIQASLNQEKQTQAIEQGQPINLIFNDTQTSPRSIYEKFRQQQTYGLERSYSG